MTYPKPFHKPHPAAGKAYVLDPKTRNVQGFFPGAIFEVEDWAYRVWEGVSWQQMAGNPTANIYAIRSAAGLPLDDRVLYGKIGGLAFLVHVSELGSQLG